MGYSSSHGAYKKVDVETASQEKLIIMLFNGAIQKAEDGKRRITSGDIEGSHNQLVRAQEIISELRNALDMSVGEIALTLDRAYEYLYHLLVQANVKKNTSQIDECISHLIEIRDTWKEAFAIQDDQQVAVPKATPTINQIGATVLDFKG
jgi:flagellar protein FliS